MSETDFYTPPTSDLDTDVEQLAANTEPASAWLRLANFLIDYLAFLLFVFIAMFLLAMVIAVTMGEDALIYIERVPDILMGTVLYIIYFIGFEATTSRTPGKLVTGTKVVNEEGLKPSFGQIFGRTLCRFIPFEIFSFLGGGSGWHDSMSRTLVVKYRR